jgi:uncharacterized membrane protein YccF (DUF307 family)
MPQFTHGGSAFVLGRDDDGAWTIWHVGYEWSTPAHVFGSDADGWNHASATLVSWDPAAMPLTAEQIAGLQERPSAGVLAIPTPHANLVAAEYSNPMASPNQPQQTVLYSTPPPAQQHLLLNVIWLVLSGFWLMIGYVVAGIIMCIFIVTIPFGIASFRLAGYVLWPFGRTVARKPTAGAGSAIGNVLWFFLVGVWMAIAHVAFGLLLCLTIIGIPLGLGNFKLAAVALAPLGKDIVSTSDPRAVKIF